MTAQDRWNAHVRQNFAGPGAFFQTFFTAFGDQVGNVPLEWGKGVDKFPQRVGSEFARFTIGGTIKSTIAAFTAGRDCSDQRACFVFHGRLVRAHGCTFRIRPGLESLEN
jgi:hypothetical protein